MFSLTSEYKYYYYGQATDMRKNFDGLCGIIQTAFNRSPVRGEVFLFMNKQANKLKMLRWETGGFVLYYKRLEEGTFQRPKVENGLSTCQIRWTDLVLIIEGIEMAKMTYRKRYKKSC